MKFLLICIAIITCHLQVISQDSPAHKIDSLKLESLKSNLPLSKGTKRVDLLNEIAARMNFVIAKSQRKDSMFFYARKAYDEATKIGYKAGTAMALLNLTYEVVQNASDSIKNLKEKDIRAAIQIGEDIRDNDILGLGYYHLSGIPAVAKSFEKQTDYYKLSVASFLKAADTLRAAEVTSWLFDCYFYRGKYEEAFDIGKKALFLSNKINERDISRSWQQFLVQYALSNMSGIFSVAGDYETAMAYLLRNNQYAIDNQTGWLMNGEIAMLFCDMGNYDSSLVYWNQWRNSPFWSTSADGHKNWGYRLRGSIHLGKKEYDSAIDTFMTGFSRMKKKFGVLPPDATNPLAEAYYGKKDFTKALEFARQGLTRQEELDVRPQMVQTYKLLSSIYHQIGNNDSAYEYLVKYYTLKDSIQNRQFLLRIYNSKKEAEEDRKTSQINLQQQKLKQQATVKNSLIAGIVLLFLLGLFVSRSFYLKRKRLQAENKNRQTELEMQALRAQMNPHFIFNCLSSINKYILKNEPDTASDYLTRFSRLIRMVLMNSQRSLIRLEDELDMLTIYLDMERMRFKNAFNYNIIFANRVDADAIFIPPLLLQPFCENAIWHGLKPLADHEQIDHEPGRLDIILSMEGKVLNCSITDNGIGRKKAAEIRSKSAEEKKSLGLKITAERLALLNQEKNAFTSYEIEDLEDEKGNANGTKVNLKISYKETVEETIV